MVTTQKPVAPVASLNVKSGQPVRITLPVSPAQPAPQSSGGSEPTCAVHRLEEALQLVESMHLTDDQKTKISLLTKTQTEASHARCAEEKKQHAVTHEQILALLTPDQNQTLRAMSEGPEHCNKGSHQGPLGHAEHI